MLGQELDSLADSVGGLIEGLQLTSHVRLLIHLHFGHLLLDLFRRGTCFPGIHNRLPFHARHLRIDNVHLLRHRASSTVQRDSSPATKGRHGQIQVLRRIAHSIFFGTRGMHGHLRVV